MKYKYQQQINCTAQSNNTKKITKKKNVNVNNKIINKS